MKKLLGLTFVAVFMMSMTSSNQVMKKDKTEQECYDASVNYANSMSNFYSYHPKIQHAIAGAYYDGCMGIQ